MKNSDTSYTNLLDELLKQKFLETDFTNPKNEMMMESIADHYLNQTIAPVANELKTVSLKSLILKYGLYLSALVLGSVLVYYITNSNERTIENSAINENPKPEINSKIILSGIENEKSEIKNENSIITISNVPSIGAETIDVKSSSHLSLQPYHPMTSTGKKVKKEMNYHNSDYIPSLTSEEIEENNKRKKKMIDKLIKFDKHTWAYIPSGSFSYKEKLISLQSFYIRTTEITNLEYRVFLFDLLIQDRKEEFLRAKPIQNLWTDRFKWSYNQPMTDQYFSHPAYNDYPVVNISYEACIQYCNWLTTEVNKKLKSQGIELMNDIRIPHEEEWAYAASGKDGKSKYANGKDTLQNEKRCYLVNYACHPMEDAVYDSTIMMWVGKSKSMNFNDDGGFHTVKADSYLPNDFGLYCMAGNVSELVWNEKSKEYGTKGGSWISVDYYLQIEANEEFIFEKEGPSPMIGFRPVFTFLWKK